MASAPLPISAPSIVRHRTRWAKPEKLLRGRSQPRMERALALLSWVVQPWSFGEEQKLWADTRCKFDASCAYVLALLCSLNFPYTNIQKPAPVLSPPAVSCYRRMTSLPDSYAMKFVHRDTGSWVSFLVTMLCF